LSEESRKRTQKWLGKWKSNVETEKKTWTHMNGSLVMTNATSTSIGPHS
jgi:hypothetical protein